MQEDGTSDGGDALLVKLDVVRGAVEVVMRDVESVVGSDAMTVVVGTPKQLSIELEVRGFHHESDPQLAAWMFPGDGSCVGMWLSDHESWDELLVRVADLIQEGIIESARHWGMAFPPCPAHPNHPMEAKVAEGIASWVCPNRSGPSIKVGMFQIRDR